MNIIHMKKDGKEDEQAVEKKYRWDEENRLLASDENGFVASYWYDADGQRTVKSSGEGEQIYVNCRASREQSQACLSFAKAQPTIICDNSEFSGGVTNTAKFSLYVSPYLVASQGGKYTKHIYIGSQRIVSKLGDLASYGADPRRIPYAGTEADGVSVDYQTKYNRQQQAIKDNYADFGVPYNGEDNNDYVNGQGFCCNDNSPDAARARMVKARAINGNFKPNDDYEKLQFYYHPDHLGISNYITNLDGEVVQHIEYVPFGEVFIEERNNTWNTPYLFNAKEYDEETGMYYYGARYYEPRISLWMSTNPLWEKKMQFSPYNFVSNNPLNRIDPIGLTDYNVDGEIRTINDGHDNLRITVGEGEFAKLQKAFAKSGNSYERLMNNLSVKNGFTTFGQYVDKDASNGYGFLITAHRPGGASYSEWSIQNRSTLSSYFNVLDGVSGTIGAGVEQLKNVNVGSNGKLYFRQNSGGIFNGNQYVTTVSAKIKYSAFIKGASRVGGAITIASSGYDIYQGYVQDGGHYGYNAQVQTAGAIGGFAGGIAGAKSGAALGAWVGSMFGGFGAIPGGIIGGFIGGAAGAYFGDTYGEKGAQQLLK